MKQLCLKDERGQLIAFIGDPDDFRAQHDSARSLAVGSKSEARLAWIDWIESTEPGNGSKLLAQALTILEAEGVSLIGLEVVPKRPEDFDRTVEFYEKFGFVYVAKFHPYTDGPVMFRDAGWNGME